MKRLTKRYKKWLVRRARAGHTERKRLPREGRNRRVSVVDAWFGDRVEEVLCVREPTRPPRVMCLDKNTDEVLSFLDSWRKKYAIKSSIKNLKRYDWTIRPPRGSSKKRIMGYVDYSAITEISTAVALVIAAEYDRGARLLGSAPPTINLHSWSDEVFSKFYELGFFSIVGLTGSISDLYMDSDLVRTMRIVSGKNTADLRRTSESLIELSKFIDESGPISEELELALNSALSEGMANVSRHAYPEDFDSEVHHVESWWVTASAHRGKRRLTVVMYDQGATIPVTLPRKKWMQAVQDFVTRNLLPHREFDFQDDATYIAGALERGQTQTGQPGRGEGLPQMKELIDICGAGSLTIWSRGGMCRYEPDTALQRTSFPYSIGGTLIEWVIDLPGGKTDARG